MRPINSIAGTLQRIIKESEQLKSQKGYQVQFYNCWNQDNEEMYWNQFINSKGFLKQHPTIKIAFFSVFGNRRIIDKVDTDIKVFYTAENLKSGKYRHYSDNCLCHNEIDLAMGFEVFQDPRYIRFPLWMDYMFRPEWDEEQIISKCRELRHPQIGADFERKFCCMVASNPGDGLRKQMYELLSSLGQVDSAGRYLHNDNSLVDLYGNDKLNYISHYSFNICPENTDAYGYVTEKIFESIMCGCIPIYWGSNLDPEPNILNRDAMILWDRKDNGASAIVKISELISNPRMLKEFMMQPRLINGAEDVILQTFKTIKDRLSTLIVEAANISTNSTFSD